MLAQSPRLPWVRVGEQIRQMKLIPILLTLGMLTVNGWAERYTPEPYSPELVNMAKAGDAKAQLALGDSYYLGNGVRKDRTEAMKWVTRSAEQGNAEAQCVLGRETTDTKKAVKWLTKSAEQGNGVAQRELGYCYVKGKGVTKDDKEAFKWFTKSAEQGDESAKKELEKLKSK